MRSFADSGFKGAPALTPMVQPACLPIAHGLVESGVLEVEPDGGCLDQEVALDLVDHRPGPRRTSASLDLRADRKAGSALLPKFSSDLVASRSAKLAAPSFHQGGGIRRRRGVAPAERTRERSSRTWMPPGPICLARQS